jgi:YD repeat-containing protein
MRPVCRPGEPPSRDHDPHTGVVTTATDPNSVVTTTTYDAFGRPTLVTQAHGASAGRQTSMEYSDASLYVITRSSLRSESIAADNGPLVSVQRFDPLGRIRLKQVLENAPEPAGLATNETLGIRTQYKYAYIGNNGYHLVSNPYRTSSDSTMGWTQTKLDNLGRAIQVQTYDGSALPSPWPSGSNSNNTGAVTSSYDTTLIGNSTDGFKVEGVKTTVTDQAGAKRSTFTDSLGRLAKVVEDPDASAYVTSYSYDALDDLTGVCQGSGCLRSFSYSSLKRLTGAVNPESGTASYLYDGNGNITSKTDPRLVVTAISYDELNRPLRKSYSGGPATVVSTPATIWCYDGDTTNHANPQRDCTGAPSGTGKNLIGRVTREQRRLHHRLQFLRCSRPRTR